MHCMLYMGELGESGWLFWPISVQQPGKKSHYWITYKYTYLLLYAVGILVTLWGLFSNSHKTWLIFIKDFKTKMKSFSCHIMYACMVTIAQIGVLLYLPLVDGSVHLWGWIPWFPEVHTQMRCSIWSCSTRSSAKLYL